MSLLTSNAYDPDEPEGAKSASGTYVSKRDAAIVGVILIVLTGLFWPIFQMLKANALNAECVRNLTSMKNAIGLYQTNNDGRYPPMYVEGDNRSPYLFNNGVPNTWASVISPYRSSFGSFTCPEAKKEENVMVQNGESGKGDIPLSYGLYRARALQPEALITDPNSAILIAETSNYGASGSYNPLPFITTDEKDVKVDGFAIGWDNSNFAFNYQTTAVTRLAFTNVSEGKFDGDKPGTRHSKHINALLVSGQLHHLIPHDSFVDRTGNRLTGLWEAR